MGIQKTCDPYKDFTILWKLKNSKERGEGHYRMAE